MKFHPSCLPGKGQIQEKADFVSWLAGKAARQFLAVGSLLLLLFWPAGTVGAAPAGAAAPKLITCGDCSSPKLALTFDDGPSPRFTPQILRLLKQYRAQGTFFVLGARVEQHPEMIQAMVQAGHEVGIHSFSHPRLTCLKPPRRALELERTWLSLHLLGCPDSGLMRPPYSDHDPPLLSYLAHTGREMILWNVDSGDWQGLDAEAIARRVLSQVKNGAIIIFHDSDEYAQADRTPTVEALKLILPALHQAGYRLVTVSELLDGGK